MSRFNHPLAKKIVIGTAVMIIAVFIGISHAEASIAITPKGYVSISFSQLAPPGTVYDWIGGAPTKTDNTNYDWSGGIPFIRLEVEACSANIANDPSSKAFGTVAASTTYYAKGSQPNNPVQDSDCTFTITNNSGGTIDLTIKGTNFTGGNDWTLTSNAPGEDTVRLTAYYSGQNPASGVVLTTNYQTFKEDIADEATLKWDFKLETGTFTDGATKTSTITLTATCE